MITTTNLLSVKDVARIMGVSEATVYRWVGHRELPSFRLKRTIRIIPEDLADFILKNSYNTKHTKKTLLEKIHKTMEVKYEQGENDNRMERGAPSA